MPTSSGRRSGRVDLKGTVNKGRVSLPRPSTTASFRPQEETLSSIYTKILRPRFVCEKFAPEVLCLTFGGRSRRTSYEKIRRSPFSTCPELQISLPCERRKRLTEVNSDGMFILRVGQILFGKELRTSVFTVTVLNLRRWGEEDGGP